MFFPTSSPHPIYYLVKKKKTKKPPPPLKGKFYTLTFNAALQEYHYFSFPQRKGYKETETFGIHYKNSNTTQCLSERESKNWSGLKFCEMLVPSSVKTIINQCS